MTHNKRLNRKVGFVPAINMTNCSVVQRDFNMWLTLFIHLRCKMYSGGENEWCHSLLYILEEGDSELETGDSKNCALTLIEHRNCCIKRYQATSIFALQINYCTEKGEEQRYLVKLLHWIHFLCSVATIVWGRQYISVFEIHHMYLKFM